MAFSRSARLSSLNVSAAASGLVRSMLLLLLPATLTGSSMQTSAGAAAAAEVRVDTRVRDDVREPVRVDARVDRAAGVAIVTRSVPFEASPLFAAAAMAVDLRVRERLVVVGSSPSAMTGEPSTDTTTSPFRGRRYVLAAAALGGMRGSNFGVIIGVANTLDLLASIVAGVSNCERYAERHAGNIRRHTIQRD